MAHLMHLTFLWCPISQSSISVINELGKVLDHHLQGQKTSRAGGRSVGQGQLQTGGEVEQ